MVVQIHTIIFLTFCWRHYLLWTSTKWVENSIFHLIPGFKWSSHIQVRRFHWKVGQGSFWSFWLKSLDRYIYEKKVKDPLTFSQQKKERIQLIFGSFCTYNYKPFCFVFFQILDVMISSFPQLFASTYA